MTLLIRIPNKYPTITQPIDVLVSHISPSRTSLSYLLEMQLNKSGEGLYRIWSRLVDQPIVEVRLEIRRRDELLEQWGITAEERQYMKFPANDTVLVHVAFPISLLPDTVKVPTTALASGALDLDQSIGEDCISKILATATDAIPVFLHCHGGGYTMGTPRASEAVTELLKHHATIGEKPKPFIYAAIKYSLAPEYPFPMAPLEATSVAAWFLERAKPKSVHLVGVSAGAGLMLSAYVGILKSTAQQQPASVVAICPMLNPACDTVSFFANETSSLVAPAPWLRWSFRCNLQMPMESHTDMGSIMVDNRNAWERSIWYSSALRDLVEPGDYIRKTRKPGVVRIVITTNSADPLHDGGVSFAETVGDVVHLRHKGSHFIGTMVDQKSLSEFRETLYTTVFGV